MTIAFFAALAALFAMALSAMSTIAACDSSSDLYQGEAYDPDGAIAVLPVTDRSEAGDAASDAPLDVVVIPLVDGSTEPSNTCATARAIGTFSGDTTGAGSVTATGTCSEWLTVHVTEDDSSALGVAMKATFTLTVTSDFDLFAYFDPNTDGLECASAPFKKSFNPGTAAETIELDWGEGTVANSNDDGRTIALAIIKAPDAPCSAKTTWNLEATH